MGSDIRSINLKPDRPTVQEALTRLERELNLARQQGRHSILKVIHGYGSTGKGGDIRIAVQLHLRELAQAGAIRGCIFGEDWSKGNEDVWQLLHVRPELKGDADLGRRNLGITVVLL
ncbi:MAG TPA: Smr/MutS family protein [Candidatus Sulfotelmatobacter sp.]|nr:Smr/MutS family protein [Candidatus Sulfotelmatobacter sp.]